MNSRSRIVILIIAILMIIIIYNNELKTYTFGEIYKLHDNAILHSITVLKRSELTHSNESVSMKSEEYEIPSGNFLLFYEYLIKFELDKVVSQKVVELEKLETYSLGINTKIDDEHYLVNLNIGENYLLVSTSEDDNIMMFKHDLEVEEYKNVIDKLEECLN